MPHLTSTSLLDRTPVSELMKCPEQPPSIMLPVLGGVPAIPAGAHGCTPQSTAGISTLSPPICLSRRSPCKNVNNPSLLHASSPASAASPSRSRLRVLTQRRRLPVGFDLAAVTIPEFVGIDDNKARELEIRADQV